MLGRAYERLERDLPDDALLLERGGRCRPLHRADWVLDVMPYETRGLSAMTADGDERFTEATWMQRRHLRPRAVAVRGRPVRLRRAARRSSRTSGTRCGCASELQRCRSRPATSRCRRGSTEQACDVQGPWVALGRTMHWLIELEGDRFDFALQARITSTPGPSSGSRARSGQGWRKSGNVPGALDGAGGSAREVHLLFEPGALDADLAAVQWQPPPARGRSRERPRPLHGARRALSAALIEEPAPLSS